LKFFPPNGPWFSPFTTRGLHPEDARIAVVRDNFSPHLTTRKDKRVGQ